MAKKMSGGDVGKTLRSFSAAGPCLTRAGGAGQIVAETACFWMVSEGPGYRDLAVRKPKPGQYSRYHTEPCSSCRDHPQTQYPLGYWD